MGSSPLVDTRPWPTIFRVDDRVLYRVEDLRGTVIESFLPSVVRVQMDSGECLGLLRDDDLEFESPLVALSRVPEHA